MSEAQARGHIFRNKNRKVWMLAYCGPRPDGTWGEMRESAQTREEKTARKALATRLRQAANHRDGLSNFEAPSQRRVLVSELLQDLLAEYRRREIKGYDRVWYRIRKGSPFGGRPRLKASRSTHDRPCPRLRRGAQAEGTEPGVG